VTVRVPAATARVEHVRVVTAAIEGGIMVTCVA